MNDEFIFDNLGDHLIDFINDPEIRPHLIEAMEFEGLTVDRICDQIKIVLNDELGEFEKCQ